MTLVTFQPARKYFFNTNNNSSNSYKYVHLSFTDRFVDLDQDRELFRTFANPF